MLKKSINLIKCLQRQFSVECIETQKLGIIGVPFQKGQGKSGPDLAADVLRQHGLTETLNKCTVDKLIIHDYGNLLFMSPNDQNETSDLYHTVRNFRAFMKCSKALIRKVPEILEKNDVFLVLGGDHSIGFGSVAGHLLHTPNLSLVWIDAHPDINLPHTTDSGNSHGMPVSLLLQELRKFWSHAKLHKFAPNCLPADQLVYIGLRDIDPYEAYIIDKLGIQAYAMDSIDRYGIAKVMEMVLDGLNANNKIHLSFDIDALDISVAPSTGTPVQGGLTLRESLYILESLSDTKRIQGMDVVEFNPKLGSADDVLTTTTTIMQIIKTVYGGQGRKGNYKHVNENLVQI